MALSETTYQLKRETFHIPPTFVIVLDDALCARALTGGASLLVPWNNASNPSVSTRSTGDRSSVSNLLFRGLATLLSLGRHIFLGTNVDQVPGLGCFGVDGGHGERGTRQIEDSGPLLLMKVS